MYLLAKPLPLLVGFNLTAKFCRFVCVCVVVGIQCTVGYNPRNTSLVPRPFPPPVFDRILHAKASLVPRPFPPPVFDRILYAKTEGGRPGRKSHVRDVR